MENKQNACENEDLLSICLSVLMKVCNFATDFKKSKAN
jgi:hypothetical protein